MTSRRERITEKRLEKLKRIRDSGIEPYPNSYQRTHTTQQAIEQLLKLEAREITEDAVKKILEAAGVAVDEARVKALIASLEGVNIDEAIQKVAVAQAAAPAAAAPAAEGGEAPKEGKEEKKKEAAEEKKDEAAAAAGLGALFG